MRLLTNLWCSVWFAACAIALCVFAVFLTLAVGPKAAGMVLERISTAVAALADELKAAP